MYKIYVYLGNTLGQPDQVHFLLLDCYMYCICLLIQLKVLIILLCSDISGLWRVLYKRVCMCT